MYQIGACVAFLDEDTSRKRISSHNKKLCFVGTSHIVGEPLPLLMVFITVGGRIFYYARLSYLFAYPVYSLEFEKQGIAKSQNRPEKGYFWSRVLTCFY